MQIEFIFDTACPWCFIGKRRFETVLKKRPSVLPDIRHRPFVLNPNLPLSGQAWGDFLQEKFGESRRVSRVLGAVENAAASVGITLNLDRIKRVPNTIDSHRLVRLGQTPKQRNDLLEAVFRAFFQEGRDLTRPETLADLGEEQGVERALVEARLRGGEDVVPVLMDSNQSQNHGVKGVPGFIFNQELAIAGAQEEEVFLKMLDTALGLMRTDPQTPVPGA